MQSMLIIALVIGFVNGGLACLLNLTISKGHILDFVREWAARRHARAAGIEELFDNIPEWESWDQRAEIYDQLYWNIALERKSFTRWLCPYCMSAYTFFLILALFIFVTGGWSLGEIILIILISLIANYTTIKWLA